VLGLPPTHLPRLQAARTSIAHTMFYTATTAAIVADRCAHDVELFGYAFDAG